MLNEYQGALELAGFDEWLRKCQLEANSLESHQTYWEEEKVGGIKLRVQGAAVTPTV